jgi:microcystin-dependent protein
MAYTTPKTWAYKESLSYSDLNTYVRDNTIYLKESLPISTILEYAGTDTPTHYLLCDGSAVSRATYSELYAKIGITYGSGDGSTTFNLPNRKGKVGVGKNSSETEFDTLGETGGAKSVSIAHVHPYSGITGTLLGEINDRDPGSNATAGDGHWHAYSGTTNAMSASDTPSVLQPYIVLNYYIKYE